MHYTIINLTRFGDLLQTACTISALKKSGEHKISLICLNQFTDVTQFIPHLDHVFDFSGAKHLTNLHAGDFSRWVESYQEIMEWVKKYHQEFQTDCIINLTPTIKTRLLAKLLSQYKGNIQEIGFFVNDFGYVYNTNVWTSYTQAVTQFRGGSPYNLIDEFRSMLGLAPEQYRLKKPEQHRLDAARKLLTEFSEPFPDTKGFVGFQLGASNPIRQWDTEHFAKLAALIWQKEKFIPVLLGTKQELVLAENFSQYADPAVPYFNYCGKSSLQELGAMLCQLTALVSNDTGTLHLATGLNVPVIGIYLATAQVWDTGPYGCKQICLEPNLACHPCNFNVTCQNNHICQKQISAETVFNALCHRLGPGGSKTVRTSLEEENTARIWEGFFQHDGFINYKPLHKEHDIRSLWMQCQRLFYKNLLNKLQNGSENTYPDLCIDNQKLLPAKLEIEKLQAFVLLAREQAFLFSKMPVQKNQEKFLASTQRVKIFLKQSQFLIPLSLLFEQLLQDNAQSMEEIIHFFDILKEELTLFSLFLKSDAEK